MHRRPGAAVPGPGVVAERRPGYVEEWVSPAEEQYDLMPGVVDDGGAGPGRWAVRWMLQEPGVAVPSPGVTEQGRANATPENHCDVASRVVRHRCLRAGWRPAGEVVSRSRTSSTRRE